MFAPLTIDPAPPAEVVPDGAPVAVVATGAVPVVIVAPGIVVVVGDDGVVSAQPAVTTAMTTRMITMTLVRKIFKLIPPDIMVIL
jgi:hypothetical protein